MSDVIGNMYGQRLALLQQEKNKGLLGRGLRGIEREALRIDREGQLAQTPHPRTLGSSLTNPAITTDYAEALMEFITPAENDSATTVAKLDAIHRFVYHKLGNEMLWSQSMPCLLPEDKDIQIATFGSSHMGTLKHVYRRGLALRYGKRMQCIAGIHYNFSVGDSLMQLLQQQEEPSGQPPRQDEKSARDFQSAQYFAQIRNFKRYSWLLTYLFGASPAVANNFLDGQSGAHLERWDDTTQFLPFATSLRMSDLGYQSEAQKNLTPLFNCVDSYIETLSDAVSRSYAPYEAFGTKVDGQWLQMNTNILQIENEYYSTIRPKRVIRSGERPIQALHARGVQYIEVRSIDVNPFSPLGIDLQTCRFLDAFLTFCLLMDSPAATLEEARENELNFAAVVREGRRPGLMLQRGGKPVSLHDWAHELLEQIHRSVRVLDASRGDSIYADALQAQVAKVNDVSLTPSACVLAEMRQRNESFIQFSLRQSREHANYFLARPPSADDNRRFTEQAAMSLEEQASIERTQVGDFDGFLAAYRAHTLGNQAI